MRTFPLFWTNTKWNSSLWFFPLLYPKWVSTKLTFKNLEPKKHFYRFIGLYSDLGTAKGGAGEKPLLSSGSIHVVLELIPTSLSCSWQCCQPLVILLRVGSKGRNLSLPPRKCFPQKYIFFFFYKAPARIFVKGISHGRSWELCSLQWFDIREKLQNSPSCGIYLLSLTFSGKIFSQPLILLNENSGFGFKSVEYLFSLWLPWDSDSLVWLIPCPRLGLVGMSAFVTSRLLVCSGASASDTGLRKRGNYIYPFKRLSSLCQSQCEIQNITSTSTRTAILILPLYLQLLAWVWLGWHAGIVIGWDLVCWSESHQ